MKKILKYQQGSKTTNTTKSSTIQVDGENSEDTSGNPSRGSIKNTGSNASASGDIGWITRVSSLLNGVDNAINPGEQYFYNWNVWRNVSFKFSYWKF